MVNGQAVQQEFGIDGVKVVTLRQRGVQVFAGRQKLRHALTIKVERVGVEIALFAAGTGSARGTGRTLGPPPTR